LGLRSGLSSTSLQASAVVTARFIGGSQAGRAQVRPVLVLRVRVFREAKPMPDRRHSSKDAQRLVVIGQGPARRRAGRVWLVGAGPGDPELLTIKAQKALLAADVVVHDGLVSDEVLALAPANARRISVAKRKSRHSYQQAEINRMLVAFAREGLEVVRLKGGDPFIFGRGGEELEACREAGVECLVVPGVSAALAA